VLRDAPCQHNEQTGAHVAMQHGRIHRRADLHAQHRSVTVGQRDSIRVLVFAMVAGWDGRRGMALAVALGREPPHHNDPPEGPDSFLADHSFDKDLSCHTYGNTITIYG